MQLTLEEPHRFVIDLVDASSPTVMMAVRGDIDLATASLLQSAMLEALSTYRPEVLDLDLTHLAFLDARGISALLRVALIGREGGCQLRLRNARPHVRRVLELTSVPTIVDVSP